MTFRGKLSFTEYSFKISKLFFHKNISNLTIEKANELFGNQQLTCTKLIKTCLDNISSNNKKTNAFITICPEKALEQANNADIRIKKNARKSKLDGIPISIKDNYCTNNIRTTAGSKFLKDFFPRYDATVVTKLEKAGCIIIGKTNMDEFGMGSSGTCSYFGPTYQPLFEDKVLAGGSSSGSASSVASQFCLASVCSDTGGSARLPASYCGLVGFKPTYGRISRYGLIAYASSMDCPSVITKTVSDACLLINTMSGKDHKDLNTIKKYCDIGIDLYSKENVRIGIPEECFIYELNNDIFNFWKKIVSKLELLGHSCSIVSIPSIKSSLSIYYTTALSEASSNLARYTGIAYGYFVETNHSIQEKRSEGLGTQIQNKILGGSLFLSHGYPENLYDLSQQYRTVLINEYKSVFANVDVLITPSTLSVAPTETEWESKPSLAHIYSDIYTVAPSLAGLPCVTVPVGKNSENKPIGIQIIADSENENKCAQMGIIIESLCEK